jgi:methylmalonyl-CoA carboxyltransferase large subunit
VAEEEISDEVMLAISAAVAAFLGERAHVRAVRLARSGAWAQQGRVFIQASHRIDVQRHQNR